jgi:hypothetical protein
VCRRLTGSAQPGGARTSDDGGCMCCVVLWCFRRAPKKHLSTRSRTPGAPSLRLQSHLHSRMPFWCASSLPSQPLRKDYRSVWPAASSRAGLLLLAAFELQIHLDAACVHARRWRRLQRRRRTVARRRKQAQVRKGYTVVPVAVLYKQTTQCVLTRGAWRGAVDAALMRRLLCYWI